jgi:hypothetical protein
MCQAATRHIHEAETERNSSNSNWWKIHEACMFALGSVKRLIVKKLEADEGIFNWTGFLQNVVIADMNFSG